MNNEPNGHRVSFLNKMFYSTAVKNSYVVVLLFLFCSLLCIWVSPVCPKPHSRRKSTFYLKQDTYRRSFIQENSTMSANNLKGQNENVLSETLDGPKNNSYHGIVGGFFGGLNARQNRLNVAINNNNNKQMNHSINNRINDEVNNGSNNRRQITNGTNEVKPNSTYVQSIANKTLLSMGIIPNVTTKLNGVLPPNNKQSYDEINIGIFNRQVNNGTNQVKPNATHIQSIANRTLLSMGINPNETDKIEPTELLPPNKTSSNESASQQNDFKIITNSINQHGNRSNTTGSNRLLAIANNTLLQMGIVPGANKGIATATGMGQGKCQPSVLRMYTFSPYIVKKAVHTLCNQVSLKT